jgi:hypothetical protein
MEAMIRSSHWLVLFGLLAAACGAGGGMVPDPGDTTVPASETTATTSTAPGATTAPIDEALQPFVDLAVADLASRLAVDPGAIEVGSAAAVVWPDGSLGCPEPGYSYTQVQVEGYRIGLEYQGVAYDYHGGGSDPPFLCESPIEP